VSVIGSSGGDTADSERAHTSTSDTSGSNHTGQKKAGGAARHPVQNEQVGTVEGEGMAPPPGVPRWITTELHGQLGALRSQNEHLTQMMVEQNVLAAVRDAEIAELKDMVVGLADSLHLKGRKTPTVSETAHYAGVEPAPKVETEVMEVEPLLVGAAGAARLLCLASSTIYAMHTEGKIPRPVRVGRKLLWRVDELRRWVEAACPGRARWEALSR